MPKPVSSLQWSTQKSSLLVLQASHFFPRYIYVRWSLHRGTLSILCGTSLLLHLGVIISKIRVPWLQTLWRPIDKLNPRVTNGCAHIPHAHQRQRWVKKIRSLYHSDQCAVSIWTVSLWTSSLTISIDDDVNSGQWKWRWGGRVPNLTPQSHGPRSWRHCRYGYHHEEPQYFTKQHIKQSYKPLVCSQMLPLERKGVCWLVSLAESVSYCLKRQGKAW